MSGDPRYIANHQLNPLTGFIENPAYLNDFDSSKKISFLDLYFKNGLRIRRTCDELGISVDTVNRHYRSDQKFREMYDDVKEKYLDELEGVSRVNALNPRSVIERIFQLKCLLPEKYGQENRPQNLSVTINVDGELLKAVTQRDQVLDAVIIPQNNESVAELSQSDHAS
jgi:AcrR family transcriptional regulator